METKLRSLLKAITYRAMGSLVTSIVVLAVTNQASLAVSVGILDSAVKIFAYFLHERLWAKIPYGRVDTKLLDTGRGETRPNLEEADAGVACEKLKGLGLSTINYQPPAINQP